MGGDADTTATAEICAPANDVGACASSGSAYGLRSWRRACEAPEPTRAFSASFGECAEARRHGAVAAAKAIGENNFAKGARWSPDGSIFLAGHDDAALRLYRMPRENMEAGAAPDGEEQAEKALLHLEPYAQVTEGGAIMDFCFFPGYTSDCPATCCFLTASQGHPLHLRDASDCSLRNSYRPYNHVDEVCHANSICFSADGSKIVAGFPQYLRVFDVQRPGRQVEDWLLSTRKGKGQKGIIGAVSASLHSPGLYAAGSYNKSACVYHEGSRGKPVAWFVDRETDYEMGGVTQLEWVGEWLLLSGHRRDHWLRAWDLRMAGGDAASQREAAVSSPMRPRALLHRFPRPTRTHQRYLFSVEGDVLATGTDDGEVLFYSLAALSEVGRISDAHGSPCVSAMLQPGSAATRLLTASGCRRFPNYDVDSPTGSRSPTPEREPQEKRRRRDHDARGAACQQLPDNTVRIWQLDWKLEAPT